MDRKNSYTTIKFRIFIPVRNKVMLVRYIALCHWRNLRARVTRFFWRFSKTQISETARIHSSAYVSSFKVKIGPDCVIGPQVVIHENSILDDKVHLAAGCVIGAEGFQFGYGIRPIIHTGGVHIHRGVQILSRSCVDKSMYGGYTEIGERSFIGEQVHIGHNVTLGKRCHLESHAMVAGHVVVGDGVTICCNASISNGLNIGNSVRIGPGAVLTNSVQDGKSLSGNFAIESEKHREFVKRAAEGDVGWLT